MKIGIIGAGNIGSTLAGDLVRLGNQVLIANSRGPETLTKLAGETGATPVSISEAAMGVDLLIITIPLKGVRSLPKDLLAHLPPESPIIDTGNYYPSRDGRIQELEAGMTDSDWTARTLGRPVIKAFNNITAHSLIHKPLPKGSKKRVALPVSGDNPSSKRIVMGIVDQIGFDPYDAGVLSESWRYQGGTPAYCPDPTIEQLPALLKRADRRKAVKNRDQSEKMMLKVPDFPPQELARLARLMAGMDTFHPRSWFSVLRLGVALMRA